VDRALSLRWGAVIDLEPDRVEDLRVEGSRVE